MKAAEEQRKREEEEERCRAAERKREEKKLEKEVTLTYFKRSIFFSKGPHGTM